MTLEGVYEILLRGLAGELPPTALHYISPEAAHAELKRRTGQDFGRDVEGWRAYLFPRVVSRGAPATGGEVTVAGTPRRSQPD